MKQISRSSMEFPKVPGRAQPAEQVEAWELRELWDIAAELCGGRDPHQALWSQLVRRTRAQEAHARP